MTNEKLIGDCASPGARRHALLSARLAGSRIWVGAGVVVVIAGLALNWDWLTAVGVAPLLVGVLPCAVMCALGLCMRGGGRECGGSGSNAATGAAPTDGRKAGP